MIDYRDFLQKAEYDLKVSEKLFKTEDYSSAAFSAQQALEKFLKSYLLKFNLVKDVQKIGHLQYSEITKESIRIFEKQKDIEESDETIKVLDSNIKHFNILLSIFKDVQESHVHKILFWKSSLGINLNKNEKNILNGIRVKINNSATKNLSVLLEYLNSESFLKQLLKKKMPVELKAKIPLFIREYIIATQRGDSHKMKIAMEKLMQAISPYLYGSGPDSFSKESSDLMIKIKMIDSAFEWYEYVLLTYPHQEIGRYPTDIEGTNSEILYCENKENLLKLIQAVKIICTKIRMSVSDSI